jgi:hypothetical protein
MSAGLNCNWRSGWWRKRRAEKLVVAIVVGCVLVALVVFGATAADAILAGAGGLACCVPAADYMGGGE